MLSLDRAGNLDQILKPLMCKENEQAELSFT
jgi:hypothetical protein